MIHYIDWTPFFTVWELRGSYPAILDDPVVGTEARKLFHDAQELLGRIVRERLLKANAVIGLFPANAVAHDDIEVYTDDSRTKVRAVIHNLRQQVEKPPGRANFCLTDFIAPKESGIVDYVGAFAVTTGIGVEELCAAFEEEHDDYQSIMVQALADRLAEAFAERLHERVRKEFWRSAPKESLTNEELVKEKYVGIRPAPGYPACPDHSEKRTLFQLLDVTRHTDITLTESCAMWPSASVSGWYFSHPESFYFGLGKIDRNQVADYAERKNVDVAEVERWLAPNLCYDPASDVTP